MPTSYGYQGYDPFGPDYNEDDFINGLISSMDTKEEDDLVNSLLQSMGDQEANQRDEYIQNGPPVDVSEYRASVGEPAEGIASTETQYNALGAIKNLGYQALRALGGNLPSMIGTIIPGDDPIERIGKENKATYDRWMQESPDVQKFNQSVANKTESLLTEIPGSAGPTVAAALTSIIPVVGPYLAATTFLDLNKEEIYDQAIAKGADEGTAQAVSWTGGAINSALDMVGLGALKNIFRPGKKITKFLVDYALATQIEGGTEAVQDVVGKVATEYATRPKDESETNFMSRMWDKKSELTADALHAYTIGAGTAAMFGVPAGVHQATTGRLSGDVVYDDDPVIAAEQKRLRDKKALAQTEDAIVNPRIENIKKETEARLAEIENRKTLAEQAKKDAETLQKAEASGETFEDLTPYLEQDLTDVQISMPTMVVDENGRQTEVEEPVDAKSAIEDINNRDAILGKMLDCLGAA